MKISSQVDICNLALLRINQRPISSFEDKSPQSDTCKAVYDQARAYMLSQYDWTFAITNIELAKIADNSEKSQLPYDDTLIEYSRKFRLPAKFLRLICVFDGFNRPIQHMHEGRPPYVVEGQCVLCDMDKCKIKFGQDEHDLNKFTIPFIECLSIDIAIRLSKIFNDSTSYLQQLTGDFERYMARAKVSDCQQTMIYSMRPSPLVSSLMEF